MFEKNIPDIANINYDPTTHVVYVKVLSKVMDLPETMTIIKAIKEISDPDLFGIVSDFTEVDTVTMEARRLFAEKDPRLLAVGIIINSHAKVLMVNLMTKLFSLKYKFKYFTDKVEAEQWVKKQVADYLHSHETDN